MNALKGKSIKCNLLCSIVASAFAILSGCEESYNPPSRVPNFSGIENIKLFERDIHDYDSYARYRSKHEKKEKDNNLAPMSAEYFLQRKIYLDNMNSARDKYPEYFKRWEARYNREH